MSANRAGGCGDDKGGALRQFVAMPPTASTAPLPLALLIAGPTCSGKSALALALAERLGGVVINADAMQVYRDLRVLTARPTPAEEARVPHALYGVRPAAAPGSVAWWRAAALAAMQGARLPILCGGSGLYLAALTAGLSPIPDPGEAARTEARAMLAEAGAPALHARLMALDPASAARIRPSDGQRLARAMEIWLATGRSLTAWQSAPPGPPPPWRFRAIHLDPPRDTLRRAIAERFDAMLESGALAEVEALLAQRLSPALPAMRAHGVPELAAVLRGESTLETAAERACLATGQYTKRQATWFRHHRLSAETFPIVANFQSVTQFSESRMADLLNFVNSPG
jgi:tRNA dimethylallyltransferase